MKSAFQKIAAALLAVLVLLACAGALFACNKGPSAAERDRQERLQSVADVKQAFLHGLKSHWQGNFKNEEIAALDDAGEYVVTAGWTQLVCDTLSESDLQTAKLKALATAMSSDEGQSLIKNFSANAELLIALVRQVGFTPTDISNLVYNILYALVDKGGSTIDYMIAEMNEIRSIAGIGVKPYSNLGNYIGNLNSAKSTYIPTPTEREQMLAAFSDARQPLGELTAFAYNTSVMGISDNMLDALFGGGGALDNISNGEIATLVDTLLLNVSDLKSALDDTSLEKLNRALDLIIKKFDNDTINSALYSQIVRYAKYAFMIVDVIPVICDIATAAGNVVKSDGFVAELRKLASIDENLNSTSKSINKSIITAKVLLEVMNIYTQAELKAIITSTGENSANDFQKSIPLFALDIALNIKSILYDFDEETGLLAAHPDIIDNESLGDIFATVLFLNPNLEKLKQKYYDYTVGKAELSDLLFIANLCSFESYDIRNPYSVHQTSLWYEYYMTEGLRKVNLTVAECMPKATADINEFISEYYEDGEIRNSLITVANWEFVKVSLSEDEAKPYSDVMTKSALPGIVALLGFIAGE